MRVRDRICDCCRKKVHIKAGHLACLRCRKNGYTRFKYSVNEKGKMVVDQWISPAYTSK